RQRARDKSVFIFGIVVPLALMGVLNMLFSGLDETAELDPVTVAASVPGDDPMASVITDTLSGIGAVDVTLHEVAADEVRDRVDSSDAELGIAVGDGFGQALTSGEPTRVEIIEGDGSGMSTDVVISVVQGTVDQLTASAVATTAGDTAGVAPDELPRIAQEVADAGDRIAMDEGQAADEQLTTRGTLVAGQAGLFLPFTVGFGVLALLPEREEGTRAR